MRRSLMAQKLEFICFEFFFPGTGNDLGDNLVQTLHFALTETQRGKAKPRLEWRSFSQWPHTEAMASEIMP